jgi:SAM-dependent methyltransferase
MSKHGPVIARYLGADYLEKNPSWDGEDSPWKASKVHELLEANHLRPESIVDVGCGAGLVLKELRNAYPKARLSGFDIAPDAARFWATPIACDITLTLGDFVELPSEQYDVLLALDVLEHLQDPFSFLVKIRFRARHAVFHFPLDLSAFSVLREKPLLNVRRKVGHLHYFTRGLALSLLDECGFEVIEARYTGAAYSAPNRSLRARMAGSFRRLGHALLGDAGVRLLGGETLMVLARPKAAL